MQRINPLRTLASYRPSLLRHDLPAGVSVFLIALPLCLGIALASGAPLFAGLLAGIVGGIVVGALSGSEVSVSGPATGLAVIVADSIAKVGSYEAFLTAVVLAGLLQIGFALLRLGRISRFFPSSVIRGMLSAIGIVIILKQIPHALGRDNDYEGEFEFQQLADGENTISEIYRAIVTASPGAMLISGVSLLLLLSWERLAGRSARSFVRNIPSTLLVVGAGVGLNESFPYWMPSWYLGDTAHRHLVQIPALGQSHSLASMLDFPDVSALSDPTIYGVAVTIALVASLETLLNLEASEQLDVARRVSSTNRELNAQGIGTIVSGLLGGLPVTSVIIRTSANVYGGARTRVSAITHGVLLLLAVVLGTSLLNRIPLSCVAAVLIVLGYKLAKPAQFRSIYAEGWSQFMPFIVTVVGIVFTDLLIGVALGAIVGVGFGLRPGSKQPFRVTRENRRVLIVLETDLSFLNKPQLKEALASLQPGDQVVIDGSKARSIDYDMHTMLHDYYETARIQGIGYELRAISPARRPSQKTLIA